MPSKCLKFCLVEIVTCSFCGFAQTTRINETVDRSHRTILLGHLHPKALAIADKGRVASSVRISYLTLTLAPSASQKAELEKLIIAQQTEGSAGYHHWLTPEEYAQRFGVSDEDVGEITRWLEGHGLKELSVARARNWIAVSGTVAQVEAAFGTEIHAYLVDGETHYSNLLDPSVPAAFGSVVKSIRGLNDFQMRPRARPVKPSNAGRRDIHYVTPEDIAKIYDITPLYTAGINGTGQKLVIAGQTEINPSDIVAFRSAYDLPASNPQTLLVPGSQNPGIQSASGDLAQSDLDLEWAGAVARDATIIFVYSTDVMTSVQYAIDENLAPVLSVSYGSCELETPASEASTFQQWGQQANAQGITWFAGSGDNGSADCGDSQNPGSAVDLPGSLAEVTGVGGTEFVEGRGTYWSLTNDTNGALALSYIPETTWNDSASDGTRSASGGGASILFLKPSWQTGTGVPGDNARHVPDVALSASTSHDGHVVYTGGHLDVYGGTSITASSFAGLTALLNQALGSGGLGNINPNLYSLAQSGWASGMFHDITTGNNNVAVGCPNGTPNCGAIAVGYSAGTGYDQTTGLGSVDAYKLVMGWNSGITASTSSATNITLPNHLNTVTAEGVMFLIAKASTATGTTPVGSILFSIDGTSLGSAVLTGSAGAATATLPVNGSRLSLGTEIITATYSGDSSAPVTIVVTTSGSTSARK